MKACMIFWQVNLYFNGGEKVENETNANNVEVGDVYTGRVLKIKPFGAIVSLPNSPPGLVHISQISSGYISNVSDILAIGDEVNVKVIQNDQVTGKIALTMKDLPQNFYDESEDDEEDDYYYERPVISAAQAASFEEKFKSWQKISNERIAGINKRNKRR